MRKSNKLILFLAVVFLFAEVQEAESARPMMSKPPMVKPTPPDLVVTVDFVKVMSWKNSKGIQCYSPRPIFTIKNTGGSTAQSFDYEIYWKLNPTHTWQMNTGNQNVKLLPGATMTIDGNNPIWDQPWCVNEDDWRPGWRIKVDIHNDVAESNEGNNMAEKIYNPVKLDYVPPRTIQKDFQKIPTPR